MEGHAKLTLLPNKFVFIVEYLQLLPAKQAAWCSGKDNDRGNTKHSFNFHKDFLEKYNLKAAKRQQSNGEVRAMHAYTRLRKAFTIFSFPERWALPLLVLWRRASEEMRLNGIDVISQPAFDSDIYEFYDYLLLQSPINDDGLDDCQEATLCLSNHVRAKYRTSRINEEEVATELPNVVEIAN